MNWFALIDGGIVNLGPQPDFDAAEKAASDKAEHIGLGTVALWILDPETAAEWRKALDE